LLFQASVLRMQKNILFTHLSIIFFCLFVPLSLMGQTSWKGTVNTAWNEAGNWTAGVPTATSNVVIGDASFTGAFQPTVNMPAACRTLTITSGTLTQSKSLYVGGNLTISTGATLSQRAAPLTVLGNFINNGTYTAAVAGATVLMSGTNQSITGTTTFSNLTILAGSTITISNNITVNTAFTVNGTFTPTENATPYVVNGTGALNVGANGILRVNAATFGANYGLSGAITLAAGSVVEYSATTIAQTVSATPTYSTLRISGSTVKTLGNNLAPLNATTAYTGRIDVQAGSTLDLSTFTAGRGTTVTGGWLHVANGATLRIGGTNTLPANFNTTQFEVNSTVEYYGTAQTVAAQTYGNLTLSTSGTKTTTATATVIHGNLAINGTANLTAAAGITVNGTTTINAGTTWTAGTFTHTLNGNYVNNGTFTGNTSTLVMDGNGVTMTGTGTNNFNNLTIGGSVTAAATTPVNVAGNLVGNGSFIHLAGGTFTLSGTTKTITGTGLTFDNLSVTGTVTVSSNINVTGNLVVSGTYTGSANVLTMSGAAKTISGAGTLSFASLFVQGTVTTAIGFTIGTALDVTGSLTASANTATFSSTSTLSGTANLFNVTATGLVLNANAVLGVAGTLAGTVNVTTNVPNTVNYNGAAATQNILTIPYHHLSLSNGNTKAAAGALTLNGDLIIAAGTTFSAGSFSHTINGNFSNGGTFTAGSGTITLAGNTNTSLTGTTSFYNFVMGKTNQANTITLNSSVTVTNNSTITQGTMYTGANSITIYNDRTGNGIIIGTVTRYFNVALSLGFNSAFESPVNTLASTAVMALGNTVTMTAIKIPVTSFNAASAINRGYQIVTGGISINVASTLSLHYEDIELNGNVENNMTIWYNTGSGWNAFGKLANSSTTNFVSYNGLLQMVSGVTYTLADAPANAPPVVRWVGGTSTDWNTAANWTVVGGGAARVPTVNDIADLGSVNFTNQPTISTAASVRSVYFGSVSTNAVTLTLAAGGSLNVTGNITGGWSANRTHTINAGAQNITIGNDLVLSDGTAGHVTNLNVSTGTITVGGNVNQTGGSNIVFSGAGALNIGVNFIYAGGGTFTPATSTVTYNGTVAQTVAAVPYNHLIINKSAAIAALAGATTVAGNLTITAGQLDLNSNATVTGNVSLSPGAIMNALNTTLSVGGNWSNSGTFAQGSSTVIFNGTGAQSISNSTFDNLTINKSAGNATLTGNATIYGNLSVNAGTLDLGTFTANRSVPGGILTVAAGANLLAGSTFPSTYSQYAFAATSTETYTGTAAQTVLPLTYGNLSFTNSGTKTLSGTTITNGNLNIGSGATLNAASYLLSTAGSWTNSGTFTPATGTVALTGAGQTIAGTTTFNKVSVTGSYTASGVSLTFNGPLAVPAGGTLTTGAGVISLNGDVFISGTFSNTGTLAFGGAAAQNILFKSAVTSNIITFNGSVTPAFYPAVTPTIATLNINNAVGVNIVSNIVVTTAFNTASTGVFNGGFFTQEIQGAFSNNGSFNSSGILYFNPSAAQILTLSGVNFVSNDNVIFGGTGAISMSFSTGTFTHVTFANTSGVTPSNNWNFGGNFILTSAATFTAGSYTFTVAGDLTANGTLNGNTSVFVMSGAGTNLAGNPLTTFYDYTVSGSVTALNDFNVSRNFTNNNAINATQGTVFFTGSTASLINGTASPYNLAQIAVRKTAGNINTTLQTNIAAVADLHIFAGTFDEGVYTITQNNGLLSIEDAAFMLVGGTNSLPAFASYYLDTLSTVNYNGSTQPVSSATPYGNLVISNAGTKTAAANLHILNNFTLSTGNFTPGPYTDTLEGNWTMTSGTFTNTGSTVLFYGTKAQTVVSTGAFNNMTINKTTNNVTIANNVSAAGTVNFVKGLIVAGNFTFSVTATGSVTGASASTGWVFGRLQKNVATGTNVTRNYEFGDATNYTPATLIFASVATAGNISGIVLTPDHPQIATSPLNPNRSVNRYWSFTNAGTVYTLTSATVNWVTADVDASALFAYFRVGNYSGGTWTLPAVTTVLANSITATGITTLGDIAVGELLINNVWTGNVSTDWFNSGNWSAGVVPIITTDATIPTGRPNYPLIITSIALTHNIIIQPASAVTVSGGTMQISGIITNTGTFTASNGTIEMNGSVAQTIAAGTFAANTINNLTANNNAGLTIGGTLNIAGILKATTGNLNTGGFVTLLSTAAQTALIDGTGNGNVNGLVTMQRYLPSGFGYKYVSSPFSDATVTQLADDINLTATFPTLYDYVENVNYSGWMTYTTVTNPLVPLAGYAANFGNAATPKTFNMSGTVNNGNISAPLFTNNNQPYTLGFNLAGNPYPSPVDWNSPGGWTKFEIDDAIYYFNAGTGDQYTGTYSSYINGVSSDGIATNIIPAMQGFFVHVSDGSYPVTALFDINNTARVNNLTPNYHRDPAPTVPLLRFSAGFADDGLPADAAVIYLDHKAVTHFDLTMDALKLMNTDPMVPNLFMRATDTSRLSIYSLPYLTDTAMVIPLGLYTKKTGWLTFRTQDLLRMPAGYHLYLKDEKGSLHEFLPDSKYRVYVSAGDDNTRFSIVFSPVAIEGTAGDADGFNAYSAYGKIIVNLPEEGQLAVTNMSGQVMFRQKMTGTGVKELGAAFSSGVYLVSFQSNKGLRTKKVFVAHQ
jgi:hypothetical protein